MNRNNRHEIEMMADLKEGESLSGELAARVEAAEAYMGRCSKQREFRIETLAAIMAGCKVVKGTIEKPAA